MVLREHTFDLVDRVEEIEAELAEIEEEKERVMEQAERVEDEDDDIDVEWDELEDEWDELDSREIELRGERKKFMETSVAYTTDVDLDEQYQDLEQEAYWETIEEQFGDVESCSFRVRELSFGQLQRVSDDMMEESFEVDVQREEVEGTPRHGYYQSEVLREAIIDWPEHAPVHEDRYGKAEPLPGDYPIPVSEWLFEKVDALNTAGDTEMGNSSLKEAMRSKK